MRRIRCINPDCIHARNFRGHNPALLCMASTGIGRVEIKCWRCKKMNIVDLGTVLMSS